MSTKLSRTEQLQAFQEEFLKGHYDGPTSGIIALAGEAGTGKTFFTLTWPYTPILHIDMEFSSEAYAQPPHAARNGYGTRWERLEMLKYKGDQGFETRFPAISASKYQTIVVDPIDQWWEWATTLARFKVDAKGEVPDYKSGQMWGEAKKQLRDWIIQTRAKCQWLFLISHMRLQWPPPKDPTKKVKYSKASEPILYLAFASFTLDRDKHSFQPPSAIIAKTEDGKTRWPAVPPRIESFTPLTLLYYLQADQEAVDLKEDGLVPAPEEDGMARLREQVELAERFRRAVGNEEAETMPEGSLD